MNNNDPLNDSTDTLNTPSTPQINRADRIMKTAVSTGLLTSAGYDWLKLATDPWHDNKVNNFKGIPDTNLGNSVTMSIVQEHTVSRPAFLAADQNWQMRVSSYPVAKRALVQNAKLVGNKCFVDATPVNYQVAPVVIDFAQSGAFSEFPVTQQSIAISIPDQYLKGPFKVAGMGIEVCNTTSQLYQQGLASVAVMNQIEDATFPATTFYTPDPNGYVVYNFQPIRSPPKTLDELILLPNTTQWHAKEGHYSVVQLTSIDRLGKSVVPTYPLLMAEDLRGETINGGTTNPVYTIPVCVPQVGYYTMPVAGGNIVNSLIPESNPGVIPMNSSVAMYTGLSPQSTLTVRVRFIIERFPNDQELDILVLATPTAAYDPIAIEIYSRLMRRLPSAVMFKQNANEDYWKSVLTKAADVVSGGLLMMPHPLAKGAGAALGAARAVLAPDEKRIKLVTKSTPRQKAEKRLEKKKTSAKTQVQVNVNKPAKPAK